MANTTLQGPSSSYSQANGNVFWADGDLVYVQAPPDRDVVCYVRCDDPTVAWEVRWTAVGIPYVPVPEPIPANNPPAFQHLTRGGSYEVNCRRQNAGDDVDFYIWIS